MPLTALIVACAARALTDLSWTEAFLLGALLSPTDPVLSSSVVTNPRVPRLVRHSLNLESGLNDGLALPAVLALSAALTIGASDVVWWRFILQDVSLGLVTGGVAAKGVPTGREHEAASHQKSLYALGIALATYGVAVLPPAGNGLIAVFVCAITLGILGPDIRDCFEDRSQDIIEVVKLGIFVVFGSLLTPRRPLGTAWGNHDRGRHALAGPAGGDLPGVDRNPRRHRDQGLHGLFWPQARRHHDLLADRAGRRDLDQRAHLQHRGPCSDVLDPATWTVGHTGCELDCATRRRARVRRVAGRGRGLECLSRRDRTARLAGPDREHRTGSSRTLLFQRG